MRIAVLIISLFFVLVVGIQSCTVALGGNLFDQQNLAAAGAIGIIVAFLFILGASFALGLPKISMIMFSIAGILGFIAAAGSQFKDMYIWAIISIVLAGMSYLGIKEKNKKDNIIPNPSAGTGGNE